MTEKNKLRIIINNKFTILWTSVIFILCLIPSSEIPKTNFTIPHFDKIIHFGMFFILSLFVNYEHKTKSFPKNLTLTILLAISLSFLSEILQKVLTSTRQFDLLDIISDIIGSLFGYYIFIKQKIIKIR